MVVVVMVGRGGGGVNASLNGMLEEMKHYRYLGAADWQGGRSGREC